LTYEVGVIDLLDEVYVVVDAVGGWQRKIDLGGGFGRRNRKSIRAGSISVGGQNRPTGCVEWTCWMRGVWLLRWWEGGSARSSGGGGFEPPMPITVGTLSISPAHRKSLAKDAEEACGMMLTHGSRWREAGMQRSGEGGGFDPIMRMPSARGQYRVPIENVGRSMQREYLV
jgi:hypothetical protein